MERMRNEDQIWRARPKSSNNSMMAPQLPGIRRNRIWQLLLALSLPGLLGPQTGCRQAAAGRGNRELVIWANPSGVEEEAFQRVCRRFEGEHPGVRVRLTGGVDSTRLTRA